MNSFRGEFEYRSNFYNSPILILGYNYPTAEHAYQYFKMVTRKGQIAIVQASTPGHAKRLSHQYPIKSDWDSKKLLVMQYVVMQKFTQNAEIASILVSSKDYIVEENEWNDTFWGTCNGTGYNHLGIILMGVRDFLFKLNGD